MAFSWLRDSFWFLGQLFVSPKCQESGIGRKLLERTLELGSDLNVTSRALITFPFNRVATALYIRYGMYPSEPIYRMVLSNAEPGGGHKTLMLTYEKVEPGSVNMGQLSAIDKHVLGIARPKHHEYFLNTQGATCYLFASEKKLEGYAYLWSNGHVGPLAVLSSKSVPGVMTEAIRLAFVQGAPQVSLMIPGSNREAIVVAFQHNFRIALPLLLMSSQQFGHWDKYLFHSPALM